MADLWETREVTKNALTSEPGGANVGKHMLHDTFCVLGLVGRRGNGCRFCVPPGGEACGDAMNGKKKKILVDR